MKVKNDQCRHFTDRTSISTHRISNKLRNSCKA